MLSEIATQHLLILDRKSNECNLKSHFVTSSPTSANLFYQRSHPVYHQVALSRQHTHNSGCPTIIMVDEVDNFVVVLPSGDGPRHPIEASFTIHGAPIAQNGWKLAWKRNRHPVIYDPLQNKKIVLRANIRSGLFDLLQQSSFPILAHRTLKVEIMFKMHHVFSKDIDNMMKFLFDAMQHVIYHNDSCIMSAVVTKHEAHPEDEESTLVKITAIDHNDSIYI